MLQTDTAPEIDDNSPIGRWRSKSGNYGRGLETKFYGAVLLIIAFQGTQELCPIDSVALLSQSKALLAQIFAELLSVSSGDYRPELGLESRNWSI